MQDAPDFIRQARIIKHMNADHRDSLSLFLRHYCRVPASSVAAAVAASSTPSAAEPSAPTLESIALTHQIIVLNHGSNDPPSGQRYYIPFHPPLSSFNETRARMKSMHEECLRGLSLSDIKVDTFVPPGPVFVISLLLVYSYTLYFSAYYSPLSFIFSSSTIAHANNINSHLDTPSIVHPHTPNMTRHLAKIATIVLIHIVETIWMAKQRLRRHQIPWGSRLWWQWVGDCMFGGVFSIRRFDGLVEDLKKRENRGGEEVVVEEQAKNLGDGERH